MKKTIFLIIMVMVLSSTVGMTTYSGRPGFDGVRSYCLCAHQSSAKGARKVIHLRFFMGRPSALTKANGLSKGRPAYPAKPNGKPFDQGHPAFPAEPNGLG